MFVYFSLSLIMGKLKPTGPNLGQAFSLRCVQACLCHATTLIIKQHNLQENSAHNNLNVSTHRLLPFPM
jgi:hypothetical protein